MEEKREQMEEIKEQNKETTNAAWDEDKQEDRVIVMVEESQLHDGIVKEGKDGINKGESQYGLAKKPRQGSNKQSLNKAKPTIPQPFSLSTEKRMSSKEKRGSNTDMSSENMTRKPKQRHGSMDFKNSHHSQPKLSRSASLSHRDQSWVNASAGDTSDLNCAKSIRGTKTSSNQNKFQGAAAENTGNIVGDNAQKMEKKRLLKGTESKHLKGTDKKERVGEMQKNSNFKALPLPRLYKKKKNSPPKSEIKKVPEKKCPRSLPKTENNKIEEDKGKGPTKTMTKEAKGTLSKILRSIKMVLSASKVITAKGVVSSA